MTLDEYAYIHWDYTGGFPAETIPPTYAAAQGCCWVCVRRYEETTLARLEPETT